MPGLELKPNRWELNSMIFRQRRLSNRDWNKKYESWFYIMFKSFLFMTFTIFLCQNSYITELANVVLWFSIQKFEYCYLLKWSKIQWTRLTNLFYWFSGTDFYLLICYDSLLLLIIISKDPMSCWNNLKDGDFGRIEDPENLRSRKHSLDDQDFYPPIKHTV